MTFNEAVKTGKLPNINRDAFVAICKECGIGVDYSNIDSYQLTSDDLKRLSVNRFVHAAGVKTITRNLHSSVISEYDKLIDKYEALYESIKDSSISDEDKKGILQVWNDLKDARIQYNNVRNNINIFRSDYGYNKNMLNAIERAANQAIKEDKREVDQKLSEQYEVLNKLVEDGKKYKTKFKKFSNDVKISRVQKKIESLQAKNGKLSSVQQRLVNKATEKYIATREKELQKYAKNLEREQIYTSRRIENNKQIDDFKNDISLSQDEIVRLKSQGGLKNSISAMGLTVEKRRMESELKRLEKERKRLDRLKNKKGSCNLSEQYTRPINMAYGM